MSPAAQSWKKQYNRSQSSFQHIHLFASPTLTHLYIKSQHFDIMPISTKLGDEFLRIPKLDVSGTNWVIYKEHFTWALDARSIVDHIDGSGSKPADPLSEETQKAVEEGEKLSEEQVKLDTEWKKELKEWRTGEAVAKQQIASSIPDSLFLKIRASGSDRKSG